MVEHKRRLIENQRGARVEGVCDLVKAGVTLDQIPQAQRVQTAMQLASFFLEYAAYEMALEEAAEDVPEIIPMAAKLDQTAQHLDDQSCVRADTSGIRMR